MTDKKASEETLAANVADADFWAGVKSGLDVRFSFAQVKTWIKSWITKSDVGLANVTNTADADKPVSTATQAELNLKANTSSLGTAAAAATTDFATAAQGGLADTAVQPGTLGALATKNKADVPGDLNVTGTPDGSQFLRDDGSWQNIPGGGDMLAANNLSDVTDAATARSNLGISDTLPTTQVFTSGSGTYATPEGCRWIEVEIVGEGGGGAGAGSSPGNGGAGGNTTFGPFMANGGSGATGAAGGAGGAASGGYVNSTGTNGQNGSGIANTAGGNGGISPLGRAGWGGAPGGGGGVAASANSGSGGGGGGCFSTPNGGGGGGSGGFVRGIITSPSSTYSYSAGAAGTAGTAGGGSGGAGAAGATGFIRVIEHYGN